MSFAHALFASFYSSAFYRRVAAEWSIGRAGVLLLLALAIGWILQIAAIQAAMQAWAEKDAERVIAALPPLALRGGELEASPPGPHEIRLGGGGELLVIDTSEAPSPPADEVVVYVTRSRVAARRSDIETRSFEIAEVVKTIEREDGPIHPDELRGLAAAMARWGPIAMYPFAVLGEGIYRLVVALVLAVAGTVFARMVGAQLDYGRLYALSLVVLVPLVLIESLLSALGTPVPGWLAAGAAVALLGFAVRAAAAPGPGGDTGLPPAYGE